MKLSACWAIVSLLLPATGFAQAPAQGPAGIRVALVKMPYTGARNVAELSATPDYLEAGGLADTLRQLGAALEPTVTVRLTEDEERSYGEWHRMGLANGHLADIVAQNRSAGRVSVGLLANCTSLLGMLGGLQHSGTARRPLRVGMVFVDSHGDFNTPETTLSGMLGGMPVAVAAGLALTNLRLKSGLDPALPTRYIVMAALRDTDPLEQELIDRSDIEFITTDDIRQRSENLHAQMRRLSRLTDVIYVHIDMDVLQPSEVPGHSLNVAGGPTSTELAEALAEMFGYEKVAALGVASTPAGDRDPDGVSRRAAYRLIAGAVRGVQQRIQQDR